MSIKHFEMATLLLDRGADVSAADSYGNTALMLASKEGHTETAALLLAWS